MKGNFQKSIIDIKNMTKHLGTYSHILKLKVAPNMDIYEQLFKKIKGVPLLISGHFYLRLIHRAFNAKSRS